MIKEKKILKRENSKQELIRELTIYIKSIVFSFLIAFIFTILLSFHARTEMIKNIYVEKNEKSKIERNIAQQIIAHSDFTQSLNERSYSVCMQVGRLYETAGDYKKAEYAYYLATKKAQPGTYSSYLKLALTLIELDKVDEALKLVDAIPDTNHKNLIKFKTKIYIVIGDKYYFENKYVKAADKYEKAHYYYSRLKRQDKKIAEAIKARLVDAYIKTASVFVSNGYNSDAVRFLNKALKFEPNNNLIKYRLAIIYSDLDPVKSLEIFEYLMAKTPQDIDYKIYNNALIKAANIMELEGNKIKAKYYRYKIHSLDLFINNKVIYKNDIKTMIKSFEVKKILFRYRLKIKFKFQNNSSRDIDTMTCEFVLRQNNKKKEIITINCVNKKTPLLSNGDYTKDINVEFGKNIFTKKELNQYSIDIYLYKDKKYKTLVDSYKIPSKSF